MLIRWRQGFTQRELAAMAQMSTTALNRLRMVAIPVCRVPGHAGLRPWRLGRLPTGPPGHGSAAGRHPPSSRAWHGCWRL